MSIPGRRERPEARRPIHLPLASFGGCVRVPARTMEFHPLDQELLALLEQAGSRGELTPGTIRSRLSKAGRDLRPSVAEIQDRIHSLWKDGRLTVEPPGPGKRDIRIWPTPPSGKSSPGAGGPVSELMIQVCSQLASAFHESNHADAKQEFARLLFNLGAERSEPEKSTTTFMGRRHHCAKPALPGDPVRIIESGWLLRNCPGDHLLSKSRVVPA